MKRLLAISSDDDVPYIVTEEVEGAASLTEYCAEATRMSFSHVLRVALDVAPVDVPPDALALGTHLAHALGDLEQVPQRRRPDVDHAFELSGQRWGGHGCRS